MKEKKTQQENGPKNIIKKMVGEKENANQNQSIKDIEFLMKNKAEIFNITPPNAKAEDKYKNS